MPQLSNSHLFLAVHLKGAELASVIRQSDQTEYLWQADPTYWGRHAPVLFPIVGRLKDDTYHAQGKSFSMKQHGLARNQMFVLSDSGDHHLQFTLESNKDTMAQYPYPFKLHITYTLRGNEVEVAYRVENLGMEPMPFSIGAHPAFNCPLTPGESFTDYYLQFEQQENCPRHLLKDGLYTGETEPLLADQDVIPLTEELFAKDALVLHQPESRWVALKAKQSERAVRISLTGFPYLGLWTKPGAPFVCLEPWQGLADYENHNGDIKEKAGIIILMPGQTHRASYTMTFE
ncbi:MAG: aldose 1-epimerase family protein [Bacteroidota bacterium]